MAGENTHKRSHQSKTPQDAQKRCLGACILGLRWLPLEVEDIPRMVLVILIIRKAIKGSWLTVLISVGGHCEFQSL